MPKVVAKEPTTKRLTIGNPARFIEVKLTLSNRKKIDIGATYLKMALYNGMLLEAEGINFMLAIIAVNNITNKDAPNCLPNLVLPA